MFHTVAKCFDIEKCEYERFILKGGYDSDEHLDNMTKKNKAVLQQPKADIEIQSPERHNNMNSDDETTDHFTGQAFTPPSKRSSCFNQKSNMVPIEYQNDPDLWYAIQASLNNDEIQAQNYFDDEYIADETGHFENSNVPDKGDTVPLL